MDNPDRSKSVADLRKRRGESQEKQFKDHIFPRPRTPRDPYWMKNKKFTFNDGQGNSDLGGNGGSFVKDTLKSVSDRMLRTSCCIDDTKSHVRDNKTETKLHSLEAKKNEAVSLDRGSKMSRIPIASPRKNLDSCMFKTDLQKEDRPLKPLKKRSQIPVRIHAKVTDVSRHLGKVKERGMGYRKKQFSSLHVKRRSRIPVLIKRPPEKAVEKNKSFKASNPPTTTENVSDTCTEKHPHSTEKKAIETRCIKTKEKTDKFIKDSCLPTKIILDTKIPPHSEATQEPKTRELNTIDASISGITSTSLKKTDQPCFEMSEEKIFQHPVCEVSIDSSCKTRSKRLKKRKDRKSHVRVDETSSDEEEAEKLPRKNRRRVRKRKKTSSKTKAVEVVGLDTINVDIKATKTGSLRTGIDDGTNNRKDAGTSINDISDQKVLKERSVDAEDVKSTEAYPTTNSGHSTHSEVFGKTRLNVSSSLSSHMSDVQHTRGGKTVIRFDEQVELIRHEDLSTDIRPLKTYSGSNLRDFQQLSFVEHVQKRWRRFKNLFKCCTCGNEE